MILNDKIQLKGRLLIKVVNRNGLITQEYDWDNLITNTGYLAAAQSLAGVPGAAVNSVAIGTDSAEPALTDTAITDPFTVPVTGITYHPNLTDDPKWVQFNFTVGFLQAVGMNIYEWGLITADGRLFSRLTRSLIAKTNEMQLVGQWTVNM